VLTGSVHTLKANTEALVVVCKETGLEVNADRNKYMVMYRDQNAVQSHSMKTDNSSFERVEEFKYSNFKYYQTAVTVVPTSCVDRKRIYFKDKHRVHTQRVRLKE
jgi:poly(3-hydroxybutyrate) depolymerase